MPSLEESDYREFARILRERVAMRAPDWTDANDSDPGITLLELFAFVAEGLAVRGGAIPERGRLSAARLARAALALAGEKGQAESGALVRNRYFTGRLLSPQDFQLEQDYFRGRLRRVNRALHGVGIVRGLQVSVRPKGRGAGEQVVVQPGFAIAPDGEEVEVRCETSADLPKAGSRLFVVLSHAERLTHPVPASGDEHVQFTRVEETFALHVEATAGENGVVLAQLIRTRGGWKIDPAFSAPRARCHQE
jgi:hypothetical protein